jgi:uncharacterized protein YjbI with pentapeptide repeats
MSDIFSTRFQQEVKNKKYTGQIFHDQSFRQIDFMLCDFSNTYFEKCDFDTVFFNQCNLCDAHFVDCHMKQCNFHDTQATRLVMKNCELCDLKSADGNFQHVHIMHSTIEYWAFSTTPLDGLQCIDCNISYWTVHDMPEAKVIFSGGVLRDAIWFDCIFKDSQFNDLELARQVIGNSVLQNCHYQNIRGSLASWQHCTLEKFSLKWNTSLPTSMPLRNLRFHQSKLSDCDFSDQVLEEAVFAEACLSHCCLQNTRLERAVFDDAKLENCSFNGAHAAASSWCRADLQRCSGIAMDLIKSRWFYANLAQCDFSDACFTHAKLHGMLNDSQKIDKLGAAQDNPTLSEIDAWYQRILPGCDQLKRSGGRHYV